MCIAMTGISNDLKDIITTRWKSSTNDSLNNLLTEMLKLVFTVTSLILYFYIDFKFVQTPSKFDWFKCHRVSVSMKRILNIYLVSIHSIWPTIRISAHFIIDNIDNEKMKIMRFILYRWIDIQLVVPMYVCSLILYMGCRRFSMPYEIHSFVDWWIGKPITQAISYKWTLNKNWTEPNHTQNSMMGFILGSLNIFTGNETNRKTKDIQFAQVKLEIVARFSFLLDWPKPFQSLNLAVGSMKILFKWEWKHITHFSTRTHVVNRWESKDRTNIEVICNW